MKLLSKILLAATLISGVSYTYAKPIITVKTNTYKDTEDRHLSGFKSVDVAGSFDVYITQGSAESVKVDAPADVMDHVVTEVENGTLKIHDKSHHGSNDWWKGDHKKIIVYVTVRDLDAIGVSGSGDVFFKDGVKADDLKVRVSGSGNVSGSIDAKTLLCSISGSGNIKLSGHAENSNISVSGSGDYSGRALTTTSTAVHVSGSGNANINASTDIEASVSGSGDVKYSGGAQHVTKSKSGSGDINGN